MMLRKPRRRTPWHRDRQGLSLYIFLPFLIFASTLLALAGGELQSFRAAHAAMTRYMQIALQQTADATQTVSPGTGAQWTAQATITQTASAIFTQDLTAEFVGTPWAHMAVHLQAFRVLTPHDVGQPAPRGYPGATITAPGYYAVVTFPWQFPWPGPGQLTIPVVAVMQANTYSAPNSTWNPAP